jgi:hypothetical protein
MVKFMSRLLYPPEMSRRKLLNWKLGGPQGRYRCWVNGRFSCSQVVSTLGLVIVMTGLETSILLFQPMSVEEAVTLHVLLIVLSIQ